MLHLVTQQTASLSCLLHAPINDPIVFMQSATFSVTVAGPHADILRSRLAHSSVYVLSVDVIARGLLDCLMKQVIVLDDAAWVALTELHTPIQTWA